VINSLFIFNYILGYNPKFKTKGIYLHHLSKMIAYMHRGINRPGVSYIARWSQRDKSRIFLLWTWVVLWRR